MVTIMSPDGKPIQVASSSLQMGGVQNSTGTYNKYKINTCLRTVNKSIAYTRVLILIIFNWKLKNMEAINQSN